MDSLLRCPKCSCIYQQPKSLDCGHIICLKCLSELFHPESSPYIDCPVCTKQTLLLNSTINLPSLSSIEELLRYYTDNDTFGDIQTPISPRYERLITTPLPYSSTAATSGSPRSQAVTSTTTTSTSTTTNTTSSISNIKSQLAQKQQILNPTPITSIPKISISGTTTAATTNHTSTTTTTNPISKPPPLAVQQARLSLEIDDKILICQLHSNERFKFYCTNKECQKLICTECIIDHNGHQFAKIPREADRKIPEIESLLGVLSQYPLKLLKQKQVIEKHIVDGTNMHRETKERITNDIDSMIKHLQERKDYLERQIDKDWNEQRIHLNNLVQKMTTNIDLIKDTNQFTQNLITERSTTEKELVQIFLSTGGKDDDNLSNSSISTLNSSSGVEYTPQTHYVYQDPKYNRMSTTLLKKHIELRKLEDESNQMFNELITNIEWKWDPEFQYPHLYQQQQQQQQQRKAPNSPLRSSISVSADGSHNMAGGRRKTIAHSPPQSTSSTPNLNPASPTSISPPIIQRTMTSSISYHGSNGSGFNPPGLVKTPSNSSVSSISSSASSMQLTNRSTGVPLLPISSSQPNIVGLAHSSSSITLNYSPPKQPSSLSGSGGLVAKKNPVFGKLLTRKDSTINHRLHYLYSIGGEHSEGTLEINTIYCFGGKESPDIVSKYDILRNQWEILDVKLPTGRYGHCAVYDGRRFVYLLGGCGAAKSMDRFDLLAKKFVPLKPMAFGRTYFHAFHNGTKLIYAVDGYASKEKRSSIEISLFDGGQLIYYLGINIDDTIPLLYRYNIRTKKLDQLSPMGHMRLTNQLVMVTK
ncbi:RING zinc finger-containing protein [Heterostelium album PN500]|uniref:RING zinc finger-containing protein n=1 Tax=Heterostelium pallidum (strain ATCC 26659 / Pp 5 / PN500) TaxID=670386 RepID=D3BNG6_HETP5|nr:RING zinc finger-containing protein [Heterostelium album PN500]EFA76917.1 RING zinc finger-containing protein [Heterostelium album PN500]|eukprot:XP_020429049.1 RING zinc finger-containing protein [Heterostelium album PN500]